MNGLALHEYELRIGWGKSVPLPAQPLYDGKVRGSHSVKFTLTIKHAGKFAFWRCTWQAPSSLN
jgi:hypothetical protein